MFRSFFFIIAFLLPAIASSQQVISMMKSTPVQIKHKNLDTGTLRVFYETKTIKDVSKPDIVEMDYMVLDIGEKGLSRFYSDNRRRVDSMMMDMMKRGGPVQFNTGMLGDMGISSMGDSREIFKNYPAGKISVTDRISSSEYLYEEARPDFKWQVEPETREILSYTCQKAVTNFRGRRYDVWFTPELPINDGPWKFSGLPGLILAVEESNKQFIFQAVGIENSNRPIDFAEKEYLKASRAEVDKIQKKFNENPVIYMSNSMPGADIKVRAIDRDGVERTGTDVKFPYNPMELE